MDWFFAGTAPDKRWRAAVDMLIAPQLSFWMLQFTLVNKMVGSLHQNEFFSARWLDSALNLVYASVRVVTTLSIATPL